MVIFTAIYARMSRKIFQNPLLQFKPYPLISYSGLPFVFIFVSPIPVLLVFLLMNTAITIQAIAFPWVLCKVLAIDKLFTLWAIFLGHSIKLKRLWPFKHTNILKGCCLPQLRHRPTNSRACGIRTRDFSFERAAAWPLAQRPITSIVCPEDFLEYQLLIEADCPSSARRRKYRDKCRSLRFAANAAKNNPLSQRTKGDVFSETRSWQSARETWW